MAIFHKSGSDLAEVVQARLAQAWRLWPVGWMPTWLPCRSVLPAHVVPSRLLRRVFLHRESEGTGATTEPSRVCVRQKTASVHVRTSAPARDGDTDNRTAPTMEHRAAGNTADAAGATSRPAGSISSPSAQSVGIVSPGMPNVVTSAGAVAGDSGAAEVATPMARGSAWDFWDRIGSPKFVLGPTAGGVLPCPVRTR
jgi:hypothetical protein